MVVVRGCRRSVVCKGGCGRPSMAIGWRGASPFGVHLRGRVGVSVRGGGGCRRALVSGMQPLCGGVQTQDGADGEVWAVWVAGGAAAHSHTYRFGRGRRMRGRGGRTFTVSPYLAKQRSVLQRHGNVAAGMTCPRVLITVFLLFMLPLFIVFHRARPCVHVSYSRAAVAVMRSVCPLPLLSNVQCFSCERYRYVAFVIIFLVLLSVHIFFLLSIGLTMRV